MSLSIKLVFENEIHRLTSLPPTFSALQQYCSSLFHYPSFQITYKDEEGDTITIACDTDLQTAYSSAPSGQSLRFLLSLPKTSSVFPSHQDRPETESESNLDERMPNQYESSLVWPRHTCDGCNTKPIVGPRFHCTVCEDFDFCENCEKSLQHEHPFMKFVSRTDDTYVNIDFTPENFIGSLMKLKNFFRNQRPKMEVKGCGCTVQDDGSVCIRWSVVNSGECKWPGDCTLVLCKGNVEVVYCDVPAMLPRQEGEIVAKAFCKTQNFKGKWKIISRSGLKLGKLKAKGSLEELSSQKLSTLIEMGCEKSLAESILATTKGDLQQAIQILFP